MENIEIFGNEVVASRKSHHGCYITTNLKNSNTYLSRDLCKMIFGPDATQGRISIVHSKIENNWYVAASPGTVFNTGYECVANEKDKESVFRVNGIASLMRRMIPSMTGTSGLEKCILNVSSSVIEYDGMKLHQLTLQQ